MAAFNNQDPVGKELQEFIQHTRDVGFLLRLVQGQNQTNSGIKWNGLVANDHITAGGDHPTPIDFIQAGLLPATAAEANTETLEVHVVDEAKMFSRDGDYTLSHKTITLRKDVVVTLLGEESWDVVKANPYMGVTAFLLIGFLPEVTSSFPDRDAFLPELFVSEEELNRFKMFMQSQAGGGGGGEEEAESDDSDGTEWEDVSEDSVGFNAEHD